MVHQEIGAKDVVAILRRRYWLIILLAVFGGVAGFVATRVLPKRYTSKTLVLVQQPEVQPVAPIATDNVNQRLATMQQQILSNARLEPVIRDLNLYPGDINRLPPEEIVDHLRQAITITAVAPMTETRAQNLPGRDRTAVAGTSSRRQRAPRHQLQSPQSEGLCPNSLAGFRA